MINKTLLLSILLAFWSAIAFSQIILDDIESDSSIVYLIELNDGSELVGTIIEKTESTLVISTTSLPRIEVPIDNIKNITELDSLNIRSDGEYWFKNPNPTRYFISPSAINLEEGEGYYRNSYLFLNSVNYGVSNNFSIGGGFEVLSTFAGTPFAYITPKIGMKISDKFYLSTGVFLASADGFIGGAVYGIGTYGNTNDNISAGLSWGFADGETSAEPLVILSGMKRISRRVSLVSENYFIPTEAYDYNLFLYGVRFFGTKLSADLGFINNQDIAELVAIGIPYVGFAVKL